MRSNVSLRRALRPLQRYGGRMAIVLGVVGCAFAFWVEHQKQTLGHWPWPLSGELINDSDESVDVWDDDHGHYDIAPHTRSRREVDVDHVREPSSGRWCKLGPHTVVVRGDGTLAKCPCWVAGPGIDCR